MLEPVAQGSLQAQRDIGRIVDLETRVSNFDVRMETFFDDLQGFRASCEKAREVSNSIRYLEQRMDDLEKCLRSLIEKTANNKAQ